MKSINELIGSHFIFGFPGKKITDNTLQFIQDYHPSGFIFMAHNYESPDQIFTLCKDLQDNSKNTLFLCVDQEGGRVARFKNPFLNLPSAMTLSNHSQFKKFYAMQAAELKSVGINLNFAPVCDLLTNQDNNVIGDRAFGCEPEDVEKKIRSLINIYNKHKVLSCAKHFPGHGDTREDSHFELPRITHSLEFLESRELLPFRAAIESNVPTIMLAHLLMDAFEKDTPIPFSKKAIEYIRNDMNFKGLIFSDDMNMKAIADHYEGFEALTKSFESGIEIVLYCDSDHLHHANLLDEFTREVSENTSLLSQLEKSYKHINDNKNKLLRTQSKMTWSELSKSKKYKEIKKILSEL